MKKFKRAQAENQASIQRYLNKNTIESSSDDDDDDDDEEKINNNSERLQQAVNKTLSSYQCEGGDGEKTLSYLTEIFQSGGAVCLICISTVKKSDPIWSCGTCYSFMHLMCIQHWIRDSLMYKHEKGIDKLWACPKCRQEYSESEAPTNYFCFCGKTINPPYQPWMIPHSCEETCGKLLQPECGHVCVLLCHPGPCPPCPKMVSTSCYCGKKGAQPRRCNAKFWSCGSPCAKNLPCKHKCPEICHSGACPPCINSVTVPCHCADQIATRMCRESIWNCEKLCGRLLPCRIHKCSGFCHLPTDCGECPLAKNRTCPCGKKRYQVSCTQPTVPTCGDTCNKLLDCKSHFCNMRCHPDACGQCLEVVTKQCRCGSFTKEIACTKDFHCNKKCTQIRQCGRHPCNKKCCDCIATNNYNVCEKTCDNLLNCRKHKCPARCHSGPCYPCPRTVVIQCRCGGSQITVPCGTTKRIKPPKCTKLCKIPPDCHHTKRESHKCHQGPCPPCRKICGLVYKKCGHDCKVVCHQNVWVKVLVNGSHQPAGPWETPKEAMQLKTFPCPPCEVSVMVTCLGGHETKPWPCYKAVPTSCLRECGQLLKCSNHACELLCHKLNDGPGSNELCKQCELPCLLPRPQGCSHACPKPCHPAPCPACKQIVKIPCHCGINSLYKRCSELTSATLDQKNELLKCGNQCPKNYACGHRCIDNCHPGSCRSKENCNKRVKITCSCTRIKKNFMCVDVQKGNAVVACDDHCEALKIEKERLREAELEKKKREEEIKNRKEIEKFERKFKPRRKSVKSDENLDQGQKNDYIFLKFMILGVCLTLLAWITTVYFNQ
ncbi:GSCOCG00010535001-RA-CDS [Cotesia congregata]|uniref:Similar to nfxl1: NF-X1-type zinc finger protein NFXL1 (Xenopus laevis) n=1 Tax=Cotesia congregata TaxID=51543 RepID=A0A8J2MD95_COTCN|nr:GSCOCG00010535001-RA-CDS [Cotesia congregata]CAG5084401.1 Similar to nfxl1: NF-X1-type zinc finger protein NFXL1 (Xenopus laevis) [Cotesia congregata]